MRYTSYSRCIIETGKVERLAFAPEHYEFVGMRRIDAETERGIPERDALWLVNCWNSRGCHYIYWV